MESLVPMPVEIRRLGVRAIRIRWRDGHVSEYANSYLRDHCPCAGCRVRPPRGLPIVARQRPPLYAATIVPAGRYALSIRWSDGHDGGIYSYQTLRTLCPCAACGPEPVREKGA